MFQNERNTSVLVRLTFLSMLVLALALLVWVATPAPSLAAPAAPAALDCNIDSDGPNDEANQKDLTQVCIEDTSVNPLLIDWNWDEISLGGANTGDACALFDTDEDGLANYAVCTQWNNGQAQTATILYACNDTSPYNCIGSVSQPLNGISCSTANAADDPFPAGANYPNDTKSSCSIPSAAVGGGTLLDVCSYPSASTPSSASDCVNVAFKKGNINVIKNLVPDDGSNWNITISGLTNHSDTLTGDGDSTGVVAVDPGTYTITEAPGTGTVTDGYSSTYVCTKNGAALTSGTGTSITGISVAAKDVVVCTFTNSSATIQVEKIAKNTAGTIYCPGREFGFSLVGTAPSTINKSFVLKSHFCAPSSTVLPYLATYKVPPGAYTIAETDGDINLPPNGWTLESVSCTVGSWTTSTSAKNATGSLTAGQTVLCTFTNRQDSPLAVNIAGFTAAAAPEGVTLAWETVSETGNAGFNVYRSESDAGPWTQVNAALIPAKAPGSAEGQAYAWTDASAEAGMTYFYQLEDVALSGETTRHDPVSVALMGPNAVGLAGFGAAAATSGPALAGLAGIALAALAGAGLRRRR